MDQTAFLLRGVAVWGQDYAISTINIDLVNKDTVQVATMNSIDI